MQFWLYKKFRDWTKTLFFKIVPANKFLNQKKKLKIISFIELYFEVKGAFRLKSLELPQISEFYGETDIPTVLYETMNSDDLEIPNIGSE